LISVPQQQLSSSTKTSRKMPPETVVKIGDVRARVGQPESSHLVPTGFGTPFPLLNLKTLKIATFF
jgi:hypothetical protein